VKETATIEDGMVTVTSGWERPSITVSEQCPRQSIDWLLDREHVGSADFKVEDLVRERVALLRLKGQAKQWTQPKEQEAIEYALWRHHENRAVYQFVMGGMHSRKDV